MAKRRYQKPFVRPLSNQVAAQGEPQTCGNGSVANLAGQPGDPANQCNDGSSPNLLNVLPYRCVSGGTASYGACIDGGGPQGCGAGGTATAACQGGGGPTAGCSTGDGP